MIVDVDRVIFDHGGDPESLLRFDQGDSPHLLQYATLTTARAVPHSDLAALIGVYEWQNGPLFALVDGDAIDGLSDGLARIRRLVAMRGDAPYLALVRMGQLTVYPVALDSKRGEAIEAVIATADDRGILIPRLVNGRPGFERKKRWISDVILNLLTQALDVMVNVGVSDSDAISFVGRALFARFLSDRGLLPDDFVASETSGSASLFDDAGRAVNTSQWLDKTFNGDFLPLSAATIKSFPAEAFQTAGNIMRGAESGQLQLDWTEDWAKLDFAHIPVGVLSQAYERYLGKHQPTKQKKEGSFYTPRHIAELMVHASFAALRADGSAHTAKVLDPAAGAGVFLITAFRQLVEERWRHEGTRPDTRALRDILYNQVRGFDINDSALRFAALGLYLMAIELDAEPAPVEKLKFERDLRQTVIFKLEGGGDQSMPSLGSLGDIGLDHQQAYDLVIGNPPWSSATNLAGWQSVIDRVSKIARDRTGDDMIDAPLPNEVLDLPFLWRAMEWAKPGGQIAFALHARLLFQRGEGMDRALSAICRSVDVTGIVNGAEVRKSDVWPKVNAPFCLLFAHNVAPSAGSGFRFVSPHLEGPLNHSGGWRIDMAQAETVTVEELCRCPELLKLLFRGTPLDREVYERIASRGHRSFGQYWQNLHGGTEGRPRNSGTGYKRLHNGSVPDSDPGGTLGKSAAPMFDLPVLPDNGLDRVLLTPETYSKFRDLNIERLDRPRPLDLYRGPMLLVHKSPSADQGRIRTAVSMTDLAFREIYYGYTAHLHSHPIDLVKYLCLFFSSKIALWHSLMTSGEFGVERDVIEKYVVQEVPFVPLENISSEQRSRLTEIFDLLVESETDERWREVDEWVGSLLGLTQDDVQVISETLALSLPFQTNSRSAQTAPDKFMIAAYCARLSEDLAPWGDRFGRGLCVTSLKTLPSSPWSFVSISPNNPQGQPMEVAFQDAMQHGADALTSSEIVYVDMTNDRLVLGRLNQARYWSISQARLAARRIIWGHVDFLAGKYAA